MQFPKPEKVRLKGEKLIALYVAAWERDLGCCVECGKAVEFGVPPHHIVFRSQGGSDTLENLQTLCQKCHYDKHN